MYTVLLYVLLLLLYINTYIHIHVHSCIYILYVDAGTLTEQEFILADRRIHCLFYLFLPHSIKAIDIEFITQTSHLVPIIPIICRTDTMTSSERNAYIILLKSTLDNISSSLGYSCVHDFNCDDILVINSYLSEYTPVMSLSARSYINAGKGNKTTSLSTSPYSNITLVTNNILITTSLSTLSPI